MSSIVNRMEPLVSQELSMNRSHNLLLQQSGLQCVNLKHSELDYHEDNIIDEILKTIRSFKTVEVISTSILFTPLECSKSNLYNFSYFWV